MKYEKIALIITCAILIVSQLQELSIATTSERDVHSAVQDGEVIQNLTAHFSVFEDETTKNEIYSLENKTIILPKKLKKQIEEMLWKDFPLENAVCVKSTNRDNIFWLSSVSQASVIKQEEISVTASCFPNEIKIHNHPEVDVCFPSYGDIIWNRNALKNTPQGVSCGQGRAEEMIFYSLV